MTTIKDLIRDYGNSILTAHEDIDDPRELEDREDELLSEVLEDIEDLHGRILG